jgi:hypothetical protein
MPRGPGTMIHDAIVTSRRAPGIEYEWIRKILWVVRKAYSRDVNRFRGN